MKCDTCDIELERTKDGDIFCRHCQKIYVPLKIQAEPCDCDILHGEPHYHINDVDVIPWDVYLDSLAGHEVCVAREQVEPPYNVISISSKARHTDFTGGGALEDGTPVVVSCGTKCSVCGGNQFNTTSGITCKKGHGGAPSA